MYNDKKAGICYRLQKVFFMIPLVTLILIIT